MEAWRGAGTGKPAEEVKAQREELAAFIVEHSFERRSVTLASGRRSDYYLDLRTTLMRPRGLRLAGELVLAKLLAGPPVEAVGGMAVGAVPLVAAVLAAAAYRAPDAGLVGFFVRKETKSHGLGRRIEGAFAAAQRVALLEDTTTTGGSTLDAVEAVREAGAEVVRILCLVDRGEGAREAFAAQGLELEPLLTRADLPIRA